MEKPMNPKDREDTMKHWDRWCKYYKEGGGGSWPRDAFESLLDYYDEIIEELERRLENYAK